MAGYPISPRVFIFPSDEDRFSHLVPADDPGPEALHGGLVTAHNGTWQWPARVIRPGPSPGTVWLAVQWTGCEPVPGAAGQLAPGERDLILADLGRLLDLLGLGDHARPQSPHEVFLMCLAELERVKGTLAGGRLRP